MQLSLTGTDGFRYGHPESYDAACLCCVPWPAVCFLPTHSVYTAVQPQTASFFCQNPFQIFLAVFFKAFGYLQIFYPFL